MELQDALHGLSAEELAGLTDAHITTARRWLRSRRAPRVIMLALALMRCGDLGAVSSAWAGWVLRRDQLWSPENEPYTPGMVRAGPLHARASVELRAQRDGVLLAAQSRPERAAHLAALAALANAHAAAQAALDALSDGLTGAEQRSLFSRLDSTRRARARAGLPTE